MEFSKMTVEELEARKNELLASIDTEGADLDAIETEMRAIKAELESRKANEAKKNEVRSLVAGGEGVVVKTPESEERKKMTVAEIRASKEYVDAYVNYIKTKDDSECRSLLMKAEDAETRALLTTDGGGTVSVPTIVYDLVKNAWENDAIASRVRRTYLQGDLKVDFEISSDGATLQTEGQSVNEESLVLGTVDIIPQLILKWVSISKNAADLRGESFLRYVVDELVHQIAKKAVDTLITKIDACGTQSTTNSVGVAAITSTTVSIDLVASALGALSDQAQDPVVIINRASWSEFKKVQYANKFNVDPFEGLPVLFNNSIKSVAVATTGETFAIVGDLGEGALFNFPNGEDQIEIVEDALTLATSGKVKEIGSQFVGIGVVGPYSFAKIVKA